MGQQRQVLDINNKRDIKNMVWILSVPAIVEQIMLSLVQYVDTAMVGSLGAVATASVGISSSSVWLINSILSSVSVGFSVQVAQAMGAEDIDGAKSVVKQAVRVCFFLGIFLVGLGMVIAPFVPVWMGGDADVIPNAILYFKIFSITFGFNLFGTVFSAMIRCTGNMKTPMVVSLLSNVVNVIFNTLLIFPSRDINIAGMNIHMWGAGMGVEGAAIGSVIAAIFLGVTMFIAVMVNENPLKVSIRECMEKNHDIVNRMYKLGIPVFLERSTITAGQVASTMIVTKLGNVALAAHTLAITAESIAYLPCVGISYAATTLVGQSIGAKRNDLALDYGKAANALGMKMLLIVGLVLYFFPHILIGIFTGDQAVIQVGAEALKIQAFAQPCSAAAIICAGSFRGAGDSKTPFQIGFSGMWFIRIPLAVLLISQFGFGLNGVWTAMCIDICVRGIISIYKHYKTDWVNKATANNV